MSLLPFIITLHMVSSLDGMIAKTDNSVSWFDVSSAYDKGVDVSRQDADQFLKTIDCYVMGANTYEHALELSKQYGWAHGDVPVMVITHRDLSIERPNIELYSSDLYKLVQEHLKPKYRNVWLVGGAMIAKEFMKQHLIDDIRLSILPVILGDGLPLFK